MVHALPEIIPDTPLDISLILNMTPTSKSETILLAALRELQAENSNLKNRVITLQASNILNETYCTKLQFQLAAKESKGTKSKGKGKLMGDGLPKMLSGDEFFERVVEFTAWQDEEEIRREQKNHIHTLWKNAEKEWEAERDQIKKENDLHDARNKSAKAKWKRAQAAAKRARKSFKEAKPIKEPKLKLPKKPTLKKFTAEYLAESDEGGSGLESEGEKEEEDGENSEESENDDDE